MQLAETFTVASKQTEMVESRSALNGWPLLAALAIALAAWVLIAFGDTVLSAAAIWLRSDTYAHGLLVVPISAYLIWRERYEVAKLSPHPSLWGLAAFIGAGALWLLGRLADVDAAQQFAVVVLLITGVWALYGGAIVRRLWFPLGFLVFAVPGGDFLLPPLMNYTADFTVGALRLAGVPVFREGNMLTIPTGRWSVVEACSGLRYLIASLTLGCLYAYLSYRSTWKRLGFIALSIIVPIIANGIRAFMIVMIGHLSNNKLAVGVDHLVYGWVFFGLVMMLMFWIGSLWRDPLSDESHGHQLESRSLMKVHIGLPLMAIAIAALASFWPAYAEGLSQRFVRANAHLSTPLPAGDWRLAPEADLRWQPDFRFARAELSKTYFKGDHRVSVLLKYYRRQKQDMEMINGANTIVRSRAEWIKTGEQTRNVAFPGGGDITIAETTLRLNEQRILVWHWFNVGGTPTSNRAVAKLLQARTRIQDGHDDAAALFLTTNIEGSPEQARSRLQDFVLQMGPSIDETLRRAKP